MFEYKVLILKLHVLQKLTVAVVAVVFIFHSSIYVKIMNYLIMPESLFLDSRLNLFAILREENKSLQIIIIKENKYPKSQ